MNITDKIKQGSIRFYNYITGKWDMTSPKQWEKYGKSALKMAEVKEKDRQRKRTGKGTPRIKTVQPIKPRPKKDTVKYKDFFTGEEKTTTEKQWRRYKSAESLSVENLLKRLRREINRATDNQLKKGLEQAKKVIEQHRKEKNFDKLKNVPEYIQKISDYYTKPSQEDTQEPHKQKGKEQGEQVNTNPDAPENRFGGPTNQWQQYLYDLLVYAYEHNLPIYADFEFTSEYINELISQVESDKNGQGDINNYINKSGDNNPTTKDDIAEYL